MKATFRRISDIEYVKHFTLESYPNPAQTHKVHAGAVAFVTGNDPRDQHYVQPKKQPSITHRVDKLKAAWGVQ